MKRKLILFDCDGTLYKQPDLPFLQMPFWSDIKNKSIDLYSRVKGCSRDSAETEFKMLFSDYHGEVSQAFEDNLPITSKEYFANTWGKIHTPTYMQEPTMRGSTIERLVSEGFEVGMLTNAPRIWAEKVLAELQLSEYFDGRIWDGEGEIRKPRPVSYLTAIAGCQRTPEETIMVGDEEKNDITGASLLGVCTIRINPYNKSTSADFQVNNVNEILQVLK